LEVVKWLLDLIPEDAITEVPDGEYSEEIINMIKLHIRCK